MNTELARRVRDLRRRGFTVAGIARQTGMPADRIDTILAEPELLAARARAAGKQPSAEGNGARRVRTR
jgi:hypothetical protein